MNFFESIRVAWSGLASNKLRSLLTMLGVIIGVAAVISLVSVGQGAKEQVTGQIQSLGSNMVIISAKPNTTGKLFIQDASDLERRVPSISRAVPSLTRSTTVKWGTETYDTTVEGTTDAYPEVRAFGVAGGRFITDQDVELRRNVTVVGYKVFTDLFGEKNPLGQQIMIGGRPFTVVGIMEKKGQGMGGDFDDRILIPVTTAQRIMGTNRVAVIYAQAKTSDLASAAVGHITSIYQAKFPTKNPGKDDAIQVVSQDQILSTIGNVTEIFTLMLGGIAGVSLLVGGIGIMNIMLVSVTERTREIGIRKALGAKKRNILGQFLIESVILSVTGGIIGILLGSGGAYLISMTSLKTSVSATAVTTAFLFAAAVGIFFGIYPAAKASNLDPIDALRYE